MPMRRRASTARRALFAPPTHSFRHSLRGVHDHSPNRNVPPTPKSKRQFSAGGSMAMGLGLLVHASTPSRCSTEATPSSRPRRRRPPIFGASIPTITARGLATNASDATIPEDVAQREDCPLCKKFGKGPCGEAFKRWLACTDRHPGKEAGGEPLHLSKCSDFAEKLAECLDANHSEYYSEGDPGDHDRYREEEPKEELKDAWSEFVREMEDGIAAGKYNLRPFPEKLNPKMEVRWASCTGAAFFAPEKDGHPVIAAYILDDGGNVIAAGSKEDMDMGDLGCVLQFKVGDGMNSVTSRALYDAAGDEIAIFSRTLLLPPDK